jgi:type VI protein secretion system component VasA
MMTESIMLKLIKDKSNVDIIKDEIKLYLDGVYKGVSDDAATVDFDVVDFEVKSIDDGDIIYVSEKEISLLYSVQYYAEVSYLEPDSYHRDTDTKDIFYTERTNGTLDSNTSVEITISVYAIHDELDVLNIDDCDITITFPERLLIDIYEMQNTDTDVGYYELW